MNNSKIVIDPGHGGDDSGAVGNGIIEKEYTLKISQYMYDRFRQLGIPVTLTRNDDITLTPSERTNKVLSAYGDNSNVIVISNHINAGGGDGAEVIYALRNKSTLSNLILNNLESEGQNVRKAYQRRLPSDTSKDYYFMHRNTGNTESIIVEYGFLDSTGDDVNQIKNNWKDYAEAVVKAIAQYLNITYVPVTGDNVYVVKSGDTLYSIAKKYNLTVNELKELNNLTTNNLSLGQILDVESPVSITENVYVVKKGDSLYSIANEFETTVDTLKTLNNLTSNLLSVGQKILLPVEDVVKTNTYTVKSGDTLYSIARLYNTTVTELKDINGLSTTLLSLGQVLQVPTSVVETMTYTVKSGDTLYSIAKKYNTSIDNIKEKNNLTSNLLSLGQTLYI